jgi:GR25 family glycosyltransferase involved in LPS biosynthesis
VLEDDVVLREDSLEKLGDLIRCLPETWDYVDLAGGAGLYIREEQPIAENLYRMDPPRCRTVCGYLITRRLCERVLQIDCPITMPIDWQLNSFLLTLQAQVLWAEPSIFIHGSERGYYTNSRKYFGNIKEI